MKKFGFGNLGSPLAVLLLLSLLVLGCRKDFAEYDSHQSTLSISVEEVRQMMGDPSSGMVSSRSPIKVPLDYTPNWDNAILNTQTGAPLVIAAVDTCCIPPDMPVKGNLIFRKDSTGTINCSLMLWFKSSDSTYVDWRAPLWTQNTFSGLVALVDAQDTIRRVASYANGSISKVLVWNKNIRDLAEDELGAPPTVEDRGGDEPRCAKWGPSAWDKIVSGFWHVIDGSGSFFNDWWDSIKENPGPPPQEPYSFFFYEFSNSPNWTWIPVTGGGGGAPTEFENYRVDCGIAMQNFIANGFYLPEYAHLDMRLCELLSELYISDNSGATNIRLQCLYANHQSAYFEDIWQYWDNSGKDQAASTVLNSFLDAACEENPSVQKAAMLRHAYCLGDMNLIDLWNRLTVECGQNFGLEISPCLAEIILSHANTSNSYQCPNGALANIINFVRAHGLNADQYIYLFTNQDEFFALNYIHDICQLDNNQISWLCNNPIRIPELYEFVTSHNTSDKHLKITKGAVKGYIDLLSSNNEEINQFINHIDGNAIGDPIWEIIKEQAAALLTELLAGYLPGGTIITIGPELLSNIEQGNYLEAFWNAIDIALSEADNFVPALKFASFSFAVIKNADKLSKFYNVLVKMQNLGDDVVYKTYLALRNRVDDIYSNFEWISNTVGARITNFGDPLEIWDDLEDAFAPITDKILTPQELAPYELAGIKLNNGTRISIKFGGNNNPNGYTIEFKKSNGWQFKIRFD